MMTVIALKPEPLTNITPKAKTDEQCLLEELGEENARIALLICERLGSEDRGLKDIAHEVTGKDAEAAARLFYTWRVRSPSLFRIYARACLSRSHVIAHAMLDEIRSEPDPHRARVLMDARKWLAAKFNRTEFGDEPQQAGAVSVTINNDGGTQVLDEIRQRLDRKRKQLKAIEGPKSMLTQPGGGVVIEGGGEG